MYLRNVHCLLHAGLVLGLFFHHEEGGYKFLRNVGCFFNGLHGVILQKVELFVTTAVRTSNPALYLESLNAQGQDLRLS
jgi:hypothetical protein